MKNYHDPKAKFIDYSGHRFNYLIVKGFSHINERGDRVWDCVCVKDGNFVKRTITNLKNKHIHSCGCYRSDVLRRNVSRQAKTMASRRCKK
jgi:hypothetical protein